MPRLCALAFVTLFTSMTACKTETVRAAVPAYLVDSTPESRTELRRAVGDMLGVRAVTISDDALTKNSMLIIEPKYLSGRDLGRPEQFRLLLSGSTCVLVHLGSDARSELARSSCVAE